MINDNGKSEEQRAALQQSSACILEKEKEAVKDNVL